VSLSIFDPVAGEYAVVETNSIPIRVRVPEGFVGLDVEGAAESIGLDLRDIKTEPARGRGGDGPNELLLAGLPLVTLLGWIVLRRSVRRRGDPASLQARRRRRAQKELARRLSRASDAREQAEALRAFLGDRTDEAGTAWEGRDVTQYAATAADVDSRAMGALAALLEELDASIWSGDGAALDTARLLSVAKEAVGGGL